MQIDYNDFVRSAHEVNMQFEKEILSFYKHSNTKPDKVQDFINRYVYVAYLKDEQVTIGAISYILNESENTVRTKIKNSIKMNLIKKTKLATDNRVYILKPTKVLIRMYEIQASRILKSILEVSPIMKKFFEGWSKELFEHYETENYPSYFKKHTDDYYKEIGTQITDGNMQYLKFNTLKDLG
jgi:predicted transcriptional regulator